MPDRGYFAWAERAFDCRAVFDKPEALDDLTVLDLSSGREWGTPATGPAAERSVRIGPHDLERP
jgi:predicted nicotinamide N-methyase